MPSASAARAAVKLLADAGLGCLLVFVFRLLAVHGKELRRDATRIESRNKVLTGTIDDMKKCSGGDPPGHPHCRD